MIECLKKSGLSIKDIKAFTEMIDRGDDSLQERLTLFRTRRDSVKKQIADLQETLDYLEFKCWYYEEAIQDGTESKVRSLTVDAIPDQYKSTKQKMSIPDSEGAVMSCELENMASSDGLYR